MKNKLCYVVPEWDLKTPTHFAYLYGFTEKLKKIFDLRLVVAKPPFFLLPKLLLARLKGYKDFYVHYSFLAAFCASWIVKVFGGRVFYWNCGLPWQYKRNFLRELFERWTYKLIDFLVTGTEGLKKQYAEHYGLPLEKIKVMPNWISSSNFQFPISNFQKKNLREKLNINDDQKIILFVHRLSKRKGAHYLPEIARQLNVLIPDSKFLLLVIGDGPEREALELKAKSLPRSEAARGYQLTAKIKFLGSLPNNQLPNYYLLADVFIMPSEEEGFPHVLLEAMAAGLPFVAFDVGGVKEIVPPEWQKYVVEKGDLPVFIEKTKELLDYPKDRAAKILQKHVQKYDLDEVIKLFVGMF